LNSRSPVPSNPLRIKAIDPPRLEIFLAFAAERSCQMCPNGCVTKSSLWFAYALSQRFLFD
jgi:hypothetical protein